MNISVKMSNLCYDMFFVQYFLAVIDVNCSLATVESLDSYLVPAVMDLYSDKTNLSKRNYLKFLVELWLLEVRNLQLLLDEIIDPVAFVNVSSSFFVMWCYCNK